MPLKHESTADAATTRVVAQQQEVEVDLLNPWHVRLRSRSPST